MGPEDVDPNHHISIVYDDKVRREERVRRLRSESAWAFSPPAETARVISNIEADPDAQQGQVIVRATYLLGTYRKGKQDLYCGRILYRLRVDDDEPRLVLKKVVLINRDGIFDNLTALP
jgi:3-phenylpropionate/cinnamic acid dioxygenase small subunit